MITDYEYEPEPTFSDYEPIECPSCLKMTRGIVVDERGDFYSPPFHDIVCHRCGESVLDDLEQREASA